MKASGRNIKTGNLPDTFKPTLICVVGPTAVGKTATAIALAKSLNTVVISADSRQFYREMSIGTAKPSAEELQAVTHYFIDSHGVEHIVSAGDFEREALNLLKDLFQRYPAVVLVGGSGLFIDALCKGLDELPTPLPGVRDKWNALYETQGIEILQQELKRVDPVYFETVDQNNPQRLIRAMEVWESTGLPFSTFRKNNQSTRPFNVLRIGLNKDREKLYDQINHRVDLMMAAGLLDEVRSLLPHKDLPALQTVGYAELFDYLENKCNLEEAISKIKQNTRRYAKRQLTWFKKNQETTWFDPADETAILDFVAKKILLP